MSSEPDIPERDAPELERLPDGFDGPFWQEIALRKSQGRDAKILVTALDGQTGIGKSNFSDYCGYVCDTTARGFNASKTTIDLQEFMRFYEVLPPGSSCILEEGEQFDARRFMTNENVEGTRAWQMGRVREIIAIINLPSRKDIDSRFERLADYWIEVKRRGFATVYKKHIHSTKGKVYWEKLQTIEWPNMDQSESFRAMQSGKLSKLDEEGPGQSLVREEVVQERIERAEKEAKMELRDQFIEELYRDVRLGASAIGGLDCVDLSEGRVRQIGGPRDG